MKYFKQTAVYIVMLFVLAIFCSCWACAANVNSFLNSICVNSHIIYKDTAYANVPKVLSSLQFLGVTCVRDSIPWHWGPDTASPTDFMTLGNAGIRFDLLFNPGIQLTPGNTIVTQNINALETIMAAVPKNTIYAVEGPNEVDNFPISYGGASGSNAAFALQQNFYTGIKSLWPQQLPVFNLTGISNLQSLTGLADYANFHSYPQNGEQPNLNGWDEWITSGLTSSLAQPLGTFQSVLTEFGYFTIPQSGWYFIGVDENTQAKAILNGLLDAHQLGISQTFIYELLDEEADPSNTNSGFHFGLFRNDYSPKPVASALHNLIKILENNGSLIGKNLNNFSFKFIGLPSTAGNFALAKQDGSLDILVWNEVPIWDHVNGVAINSAPIKITLQLGYDCPIKVFDPFVSLNPIQTLNAVKNVSINLPDHPIIINVR